MDDKIYIDAMQCSASHGHHSFELCGPDDHNKGYNFVCVTCGEKFILVSQKQLDKLSEILNITVSRRPPTQNN